MTIFLILTLLLIKHFIADFVVQSHYQFENKGRYGHLGGLLHASIHATGTLLVLIWFFPWHAALIAAICDGIVHYHIDWAKEHINAHFHLTMQNDRFWTILGLDQLCHQLTYIAILTILY